MCGRYTLAVPEGQLVEAFDVGPLTFDYVPRFNIAPGQDAPVVAEDRYGRRAGLLRWGLVPGWMDEPGSGFVNARAESVARKPSFRDAFRRRRCLVPADGFYEWQGSEKQPYWLHPVRGGPIAFAGIWESWRRPDSEPRHTFAIITTDASADVRPVHDRMPVVLDRAHWDDWLDRTTDEAVLVSLLRPAPEGAFRARPVSRRVNRPSEDTPELLEEVALDDS